MSLTNPFRSKIIAFTINKWFDRFILIVIFANCAFLSMENEVEIVTEHSEKIDEIFLYIYTLEMALKIISMGFFMRPYSYLRDSWNILDFLVVASGWVSKMIVD